MDTIYYNNLQFFYVFIIFFHFFCLLFVFLLLMDKDINNYIQIKNQPHL